MLKDECHDLLIHSDDGKYGEASIAMEKYDAINYKISEKSKELIPKFSDNFKTEFRITTGYNEKSLEIVTVEIKEGKSSIENINFGTTYD